MTVTIVALSFVLTAKLSGDSESKIARVRKSGKRAEAVVTSVEDTGITAGNNPRIRLGVRVKPPGEPEFVAVKAMVVSRLGVPQVGSTIRVAYDPANPNDFVLDGPSAIRGPAAPAVSTEPKRPTDALAQLKQLDELRASGTLTASEFEAAKAKLLSEL